MVAHLKKFIISNLKHSREILKNGEFGALVKIGDYKEIARIIENFKFNKSIKKIEKGFKTLKIMIIEKLFSIL